MEVVKRTNGDLPEEKTIVRAAIPHGTNVEEKEEAGQRIFTWRDAQGEHRVVVPTSANVELRRAPDITQDSIWAEAAHLSVVASPHEKLQRLSLRTQRAAAILPAHKPVG